MDADPQYLEMLARAICRANRGALGLYRKDEGLDAAVEHGWSNFLPEARAAAEVPHERS